MAKGVRKRRRFLDDEQASAVAVGFILVLGLITAAFIEIQVHYLPIWEEGREAADARSVEGGLKTVLADVRHLAENRTQGARVSSLGAEPERPGLFSAPTPPGQVLFTPDDAQMTLYGPRLTVQEENGTVLHAVSESWASFAPGVTIADVTRLESLRLRFPDDIDNDHNKRATIEVKDADGQDAGDWEAKLVDIDVQGNKIDLAQFYVETTDADGEILYQGTVTIDNKDVSPAPPNVWLDPLSLEYGLTRLLAAAKAPYDLTLETSGNMEGDYAATYWRDAGSGREALVGGGRVDTQPTFTYDSGTLRYRATNIYYSEQEWVLEHGALVVTQGTDGAAFRVPPDVDATLDDGTLLLAMSLPRIDGDWTHVFPSGPVTVRSETTEFGGLTALAPLLIVNVTTEFPDLWEEFFDDLLDPLAGFDAGEEYAVAVAGDVVTLTVYGPTAAPGSIVEDLFLELREASIELRIDV